MDPDRTFLLNINELLVPSSYTPPDIAKYKFVHRCTTQEKQYLFILTVNPRKYALACSNAEIEPFLSTLA